jgi:hypothetical protein
MGKFFRVIQHIGEKIIISFIVHGRRSIKLEEIAILSKRVIEIPGKNSQIHNDAKYGYNGKSMPFTINHCRCKPKKLSLWE